MSKEAYWLFLYRNKSQLLLAVNIVAIMNTQENVVDE